MPSRLSANVGAIQEIGSIRRSTTTKGMTLLHAHRLFSSLRSGAGALSSAASASLFASPARLFTRSMGLWSSNAVKQWVGEQAIAHPTTWRPYWYNGRWRAPELSRRLQSLRAKEAIRRGELKLEPTIMVPPPKFKGHKRDKMKPVARESIAAKMEEMPKLIAEYRQAARERRQKLRADSRFK